jgi:hypothetical protein
MKNMYQCIGYAIAFGSVDLLIFFAIYFMFYLFVRGFPLSDSVYSAYLMVFWRVLFLQWILQMVGVGSLRYGGMEAKLLAILACTLGAFVMSFAIFLPRLALSIWHAFTFADDSLGRGLALLISSTWTWYIFCKFNRIKRVSISQS